MSNSDEKFSYEAIERMKKIFDIHQDKELAELLGIASSAIVGWKKRNSIPLDVLRSVASQKNVSLDWLINGDERQQLDEMETELLVRFKRLDFSQKLQVFNQLGGGQTNGVNQTNGDHGINVGGNVAIGK